MVLVTQPLPDSRTTETPAAALERDGLVRALREPGAATATICGWCGRVSVEGTWLDRGRLHHDDLPADVHRRSSHGICPDCLAMVRRSAGGTSHRREYRCTSCGYGAFAAASPPRCPMCGGTTWLYAAPDPPGRLRPQS